MTALPEPASPLPTPGNEEVFYVTCRKCGSEAPVNMAYRPYIKSDFIDSCRRCRPVL
jgi:hypothetical protein